MLIINLSRSVSSSEDTGKKKKYKPYTTTNYMKYLLPLLLLPSTCFAQTLPSNYEQLVKDEIPSVIKWRRFIHEHPELSNEEVNTAAYVAEHLKRLGMEVKTGVAKYGVVGILKGGKPGPVVALRADMDALPITEIPHVPFASAVTAMYNEQKVGVMHACGHDAHIAILMGTAEILSKIKNDVPGTVVFIFQPAEEGAPPGVEAGAKLMVKEGVMDDPKVSAIFGLHIESNIPAGEIHYKAGAFMAASDWFSIKVTGKGAHGSRPWDGIDPIAISAQIIEGLQNIVSRQANLATAPVVITVGAINGGVRHNIIPDDCTMKGTIRTFDSKMQDDVHQRIKRTAELIAQSAGATAEVTIIKKTLVTYNTPSLVQSMLPSLQKAAGTDRVKEREWNTAAEDFSYYGTMAPSFFFNLGGLPPGNDPAKAPLHHTADFYIDESGFDAGVKAFCQLVFDYASSKEK